MSLANLLSPKSLEDFIGQTHLIGKNAPLYQALIKRHFPHAFFYGPPGVGKTSLAKIIANTLERPLLFFNATDFKLDDLRLKLKNYQNTLLKPTIFIDETHRLNKTQQEFLLPIMEKEQALVLGASTQDPRYTLTHAIRSRSFVFELFPLNSIELEELCSKALLLLKVSIEPSAKNYLLNNSAGDARALLNLLDLSAKIENPITLETLKSLRPHSLNDGSASDDTHYNLTSALIKSLRGSDENASLYYLARLIAGGENPEFIARRLVIFASEDIGNANPNALNLATSTLLSVKQIGYPEARIILSQCVIYLACSPKSNTAYNAINSALDAIKSGVIYPVPKHLLPHAKDYLYPHDYNGYVKQDYLERPLKFVYSQKIGFEKTLKEWLEKIKG
ncbi:replication-associated recombination protein A [Helicobacter cetorum]|uniref:Replication-associated recombination protein A n=1 Tax=Helicobacter cetorum (strain ATCC BAA-429 / MIT 00-7128) TaxID=182217 RepID=I0EM38_HELC0|nr:replication-associated recombination protein A [Helicobacter cetorum]AFI04007.1 recombination factor protein RarA [Helicobacter cetorum MIT 00-7128]